MNPSLNAPIAIATPATFGLLAFCAVTGEWLLMLGLPAGVVGFAVTYLKANRLTAPTHFSNAWFAAIAWSYMALMVVGGVRAMFG
nr:hypothetical protein [Nitrosomonas nitrosa]